MAELLAPAGNLEKLRYAVQYGADAVYLAGPRLGLRAYAGNFSAEEMRAGIDYAHAHGAKVYVTVNSYPHNAQLIGLKDYVRSLEELQADALIVADPSNPRELGRCAFLGEYAPRGTSGTSPRIAA